MIVHDDVQFFRTVFQQAAACLNAVEESYLDALRRAVDLLVDAITSGKAILVFGNGGSAADAQHIVAELVGRFGRDRPPVRAVALSTNSALLTAWSNDKSYDDAFARELRALAQPGDVAWAISTSGTSPSVITALESARACGLRTIGLTGATGGAMRERCDVLITAPATDTPRIQELHVVTYHAICGRLEDRLFGSQP